MLTRRGLGIAYLLGVGGGLLFLLVGYIPFQLGPDPSTFLGTLTASLLAGVYLFVGYWLYRVEIDARSIWRIALCSAGGIALPVGLGVLLATTGTDFTIDLTLRDLSVNLIAVGGVLGIVVGMSLHIRDEHREVKQVNSVNRVFNRVLRHNLRNDMAIVLGHVEALEEGAVEDEAWAYEAVKDKIREVIETSSAVRHVNTLGEDDRGPTDLVEVAERQIASARMTYPQATFETDLPETAWARVGDSFETVLDNLIENAVEHAEGDAPTIQVEIERRPGRSPSVVVRVADDGPGIPQSELDTLDSPSASPVEHGSGLGLWLVKWLVDHYDGSIDFDVSHGRGTTVVIEVPGARNEAANTEPRTV